LQVVLLTYKFLIANPIAKAYNKAKEVVANALTPQSLAVATA